MVTVTMTMTMTDASSSSNTSLAGSGSGSNDTPTHDHDHHHHYAPHYQLPVAHPPPLAKSLYQLILYHGLVPILVPIIAPVAILYKYFSDTAFRTTFSPALYKLYSLIDKSTEFPISKTNYYQNPSLLKSLWELHPSARAYIDSATGLPLLEYQMQEGYCGSATQRCILRSFGLSSSALPPQKRGESKPISWCAHIIQMAQESSNDTIHISTRIIEGNVTYDTFMNELRCGLSNPNVRIACNFLRSVLMGFEKVRYLPMNFLLSVMGGHFSPIIGILDSPSSENLGNDDANYPLVAIFDTNHKYKGVYFVPAKRLYDAVNTLDLFNNSHRAIILVEKKG